MGGSSTKLKLLQKGKITKAAPSSRKLRKVKLQNEKASGKIQEDKASG
jgi:hypothetical protein